MPNQNTNNFINSPKPKLLYIAIIIGAVILAGAGVASGYYIRKSVDKNPGSVVTPVPSNTNTTPTVPEEKKPEQPIEQITWNQPEEIASLKIFEPKVESFDFDREKETRYFKVGHFNSGSFKGGDIVIVSSVPEGPSAYPSFYRFIKEDSKLTFLSKYSSALYEGDGFVRNKFTIDEKTTIKELDFPASITYLGQTFKTDTYVNAFFNMNEVKKIFTHETLGEIYTTDMPPHTSDYANPQTFSSIFDRNGFYIQAADGTVRVYKPSLDFVGENNVPSITWKDGTTNTNEYSYTDVGGCGSENYLSVVPTGLLDINRDLRLTGTTSKEKDVYEFTDSNHLSLKSYYENRYTPYQEKKVSYTQFIAGHPIIFTKDTFGRLVKLENKKYVPQAECGKPVIYLYPKQTTDVSVKVTPEGGLTYSEPTYNNGWKVRSDKESNITDLKSGKTYPYLFWEGKGAIYEQPKKGFVVAQTEVHNFLVEKLSKLGLIEKETNDFLEFWEPRMQGSPYYFVTFLGNREMDQIAPLSIEPKPDTTIRLLMDFSPLEKPIEIDGYNIKTPQRDGFTVVEWGGVLR